VKAFESQPLAVTAVVDVFAVRAENLVQDDGYLVVGEVHDWIDATHEGRHLVMIEHAVAVRIELLEHHADLGIVQGIHLARVQAVHFRSEVRGCLHRIHAALQCLSPRRCLGRYRDGSS